MGIVKWFVGVLMLLLFFLDFSRVAEAARVHFDRNIQLPSENADESTGTKWAVLVAGSAGFSNYRHQVIFVQIHPP